MGCRIMAHGSKIPAPEKLHDLQQHGPLTPWPAAVNLGAGDVDGQSVLHFYFEFGQIIQSDQTIIFAMIGRNFLGQIALIKIIARRP